ncbi:MAG: hypothetical protein QNJ44_05040 [Rhodobacter sp.]|nr:hypothetical protein [Rhodobacter sp.]
MTSFSSVTATAQDNSGKDCATLRVENGWSRAQYRECRRVEVQANIDRLDAEFAEMRDWLRARGLDVNDAGHITDPAGRTLAQIEASNAALAASNADLAASNAALSAEIKSYRLRSKIADEKYERILREFEQTILQGQ